MDELAEKIISRLNRTTGLHESLNRLFPETKGWEFQLSTDPAFIQAAYGPPGIEVPILPENPGRLEEYAAGSDCCVVTHYPPARRRGRRFDCVPTKVSSSARRRTTHSGIALSDPW